MKKSRLKRVMSLALSISLVLSISSFTGAQASEGSYSKSIPVLKLEGNITSFSNQYPIVLVHGLFGWGSNEVAGQYYWGGASSMQKDLESQGYTVYTPSIGPVSSNWDRACELYAYLVGGKVDYGAAHASKYGHERYGRTFPGVLPDLNNPNSTLKIQLVGHSMGGETIRMLAQLLENGDAAESAAVTDGSVSPLFTGKCRHWIEGITTVCTPNDGSQYDDIEYDLEPLAHQFISILAATNSVNIDDSNLGLDFKLDQWGLTRNAGESYKSYFDRVMASKLWKKTNDLSVYDLDTDGAAVLNSYAKAQPDIYYFSISCSDTYAALLYPHIQLPNTNMNPLMLKSSAFMGSYVRNMPGHVAINSSWWKNDGIVSVRSAIRPHSGSTDAYNENYGVSSDGKYVFKSGTAKGTWNYLEEIKDTDHINVVGQSTNKTYLENKFYQLAAMLESIPS